jgi:hypothetical protein
VCRHARPPAGQPICLLRFLRYASHMSVCVCLQAAQSMQQYSGWAPKDFDESALDGALATADGQTTTQAAEKSAPEAQQQQPSGFVYDGNSGGSFAKPCKDQLHPIRHTKQGI